MANKILLLFVFSALIASDHQSKFCHQPAQAFLVSETDIRNLIIGEERSERFNYFDLYVRETFFEQIVKVYFPKSHMYQYQVDTLKDLYYMTGHLSFTLDAEHNTSYHRMIARELSSSIQKRSNFQITDIQNNLNKEANILGAFVNITLKNDLWSFLLNDSSYPLIAHRYNVTLFFYACQHAYIPPLTLNWIKEKFNALKRSNISLINQHYHILEKEKESYKKNIEMYNLFLEIENIYKNMEKNEIPKKMCSIQLEEILMPQREFQRKQNPPGHDLKKYTNQTSQSVKTQNTFQQQLPIITLESNPSPQVRLPIFTNVTNNYDTSDEWDFENEDACHEEFFEDLRTMTFSIYEGHLDEVGQNDENRSDLET